MTTRFLNARASAAALAAALLLAACGGESAPANGAAEPDAPSAAAAAAAAPAMWRMTDEDSEIVLFGTFHLLPPGTEWRTDAFEAAMERTETTYTEADVTSPEAQAKLQQLVQQYGLNPPGVTLSGLLGEERAAAFAEVAGRYGAPMQNFEPLRPWLAMLSLSQAAYAQAGFDPTSGVEPVVLAAAAEEGDAIAYLETAERQIEALASLDEEEMLGNFDASMEQFDNLEQQLLDSVEAWRVGDIDGLDALLLEEARTMAPGAFEAIFTKRNAEWVVDIKELMAGEGDYFIAVGAGHLVGEASVVEMLEDEGFAVERVQ